MREYKISYGCTTDDDMVHVSEFSGAVASSTHLTNVVKDIITDLIEDGQEIVSINISMKLEK